MKTLRLLSALLMLAAAGSAQAVTFTEDFEGEFPAWESGWFGVNSDANNFYCGGVGNCNDRGNNPDGLWLAGTGGFSAPILVSFADGFASSITSLSLDVAGYAPTTLSAWDKDGALIFSQAVTLTQGAYTDPGTYARYSITSTNGIGAFGFSDFAAGNTSIDNITVGAVPEPSTYALMGLGLVALGAAARRRKAA
jgi:hypothetical protein